MVLDNMYSSAHSSITKFALSALIALLICSDVKTVNAAFSSSIGNNYISPVILPSSIAATAPTASGKSLKPLRVHFANRNRLRQLSAINLEIEGDDDDNPVARKQRVQLNDAIYDADAMERSLTNLDDMHNAAEAGARSSGSKADKLWHKMREEATKEARDEPLLISYLFSNILNHDTLEAALSFHLANRLASPSMGSTQIQKIFREVFDNGELNTFTSSPCE
jgi:hypothetical protein